MLGVGSRMGPEIYFKFACRKDHRSAYSSIFLADRRAGTVAGAGLDSDQRRVVATLRRLQRGGKFEAVAGNDTVIHGRPW